MCEHCGLSCAGEQGCTATLTSTLVANAQKTLEKSDEVQPGYDGLEAFESTPSEAEVPGVISDDDKVNSVI